MWGKPPPPATELRQQWHDSLREQLKQSPFKEIKGLAIANEGFRDFQDSGTATAVLYSL
jgi:hypothetical protein